MTHGRALPTHRRFALTGRSRVLDPTTHAVRRDLADVELADRVFAPHYALALPALVAVDNAVLLAEPRADADVRGEMARGDVFRVLEVADAFAWGQSAATGAVGFVDRHAIEWQPSP